MISFLDIKGTEQLGLVAQECAWRHGIVEDNSSLGTEGPCNYDGSDFKKPELGELMRDTSGLRGGVVERVDVSWMQAKDGIWI